MVKIRLMRMGAKKNPHYRVVVIDARKRRSSDYLELLGYYDPRETIETPLKINTERAEHWLSQGAQPTDTALKLLERAGVTAGKVEAKRGRDYTARTGASA
jgi:small subunit ribosomal protein S16